MSYQISPGNIFGRIGTGLGKGLAEQLPKEIERERLSSGLQQFEQDSANLSPMQSLARLASIPGALDHPQLIQSLGELAKLQNIRNAYGKGRRGTQDDTNTRGVSQPSINDVTFANLPERKIQKASQPTLSSQEEQQLDKPGIVSDNPLQEKYMPKPPWSTERRNDVIGRILDTGQAQTLQEAVNLASDEERRDLERPAAERAIRDQRLDVQKASDVEFENQLQTLLQKQGKDTYKDVTGEMQLNLKKSMYNDISTNPKLNEKTAAEKWTKKGLDLAKQKSELNSMARRSLDEKIFPGKKEETLKKLVAAEKVFRETGNSEELYNFLRTKNSSDKTGFGLSEGGAALVAFPRSENVKNLIKKANLNVSDLEDQKVFSRKFAKDISQVMLPTDSFLAIAREARDKYAFFNIPSFFEYLIDNQNDLGLTPRLKRELTQWNNDFFPNWGDIAIFPAITKSVAND